MVRQLQFDGHLRAYKGCVFLQGVYRDMYSCPERCADKLLRVHSHGRAIEPSYYCCCSWLAGGQSPVPVQRQWVQQLQELCHQAQANNVTRWCALCDLRCGRYSILLRTYVRRCPSFYFYEECPVCHFLLGCCSASPAVGLR